MIGPLTITLSRDNPNEFELSGAFPEPGGSHSSSRMVREARSTQGASSCKKTTTTPKPTTTTTASTGTTKTTPPAPGTVTFTLTSPAKVVNPSAPELKIDAAAGKAVWDHTGANGGAGKGGEWKITYTFKVPDSVTTGKSSSISMSLKAESVVPSQPLFVQMSALAPDFRQDLGINYPSPAEAGKTYSVPLSMGYSSAKELWIIIHVAAGEITYIYKRAG